MVNALNDMANLAIKGHVTRGEEVIEILEMLGGSNPHNYSAHCDSLCFYIGKNTNSIYYDWVRGYYEDGNTLVFTLEEFLEKYPYKVGDKVRIPNYESEIRISGIHWDGYNVQYEIVTDEVEWYSTEELNNFNEPRKEETMDKASKTVFDAHAQCCDISNKIIKKETMGKEISGAIVDRFIRLEGYDFYDDKGNVIDTKEITMKKKKPKYPKTYEECCEVLGINELPYMAYTWNRNEEVILQEYQISTIEKLDRFRKLLICRDAYWKLAGDWEPEYKTLVNNEYFTIHTFNGEIVKSMTSHRQSILAFPTEEIRDKFYENFKDLIEKCNELL